MSIKAARELLNSLPEGSVIDRTQISKQTGLDNSTLGKILQTEFKNKNFITGEKANRLKAFNALKKLIEENKNISFSALEKEIKVPSTVIQRVYNENFKGQGVIGRSRDANKVIKEIIDSGVTDVNQIQKIAKDKYKINIAERTINKATNLATDFSVEQYADDYRKMTSDFRYVPKYVKPATTKGLSTNQKEAKRIVKAEVDGFEEKLLTNINKRKKLKRDADPEKRARDLASRSERRTTRRLREKDVALTEAEKKINLDQRRFTKEVLNNPIRKNPSLVLNNEDLMNRLSITVSNNGDIIKLNKPPGLTKESLIKRGLFEIDHQRDIYKEGKMKNLPYNRNPIMGPHNRSNGFKATAERYIKKNPNPNDPKVQKILQVAEELKVTLQPDIPEGIFKTKGIGYKQIGGPVEKFKNFAEPILNKTGALDIEKLKTAYNNEKKGSPLRKTFERIVACKDGCFVKVANKNPEKVIRLFRGIEPAKQTELYKATKGMPGMYDESLKGRFFFKNPEDARYYAQRQGTLTGKVLSVDVPEKYVNIGEKVSKRRRGPRLSDEVILPKKFVGKETVNIPQTAMARAGAIVEKLKYDNIKGAFVNVNKGDSVAPQSEIKQYAIDNPMEVKVGEPAKLPKPNKSVLKTVGKTLAAVGAPLPTALLDGYFINKQVEEGKSTAEIASNPLNWLGLATMSPLTKAAGLADKSGKLSSVLRLGLNPGTISGISRFAGLPGLAISTAVTAYDQYNKYKNQEGFIYKLFNKEES